jgi:hypothetical protein
MLASLFNRRGHSQQTRVALGQSTHRGTHVLQLAFNFPVSRHLQIHQNCQLNSVMNDMSCVKQGSVAATFKLQLHEAGQLVLDTTQLRCITFLATIEATRLRSTFLNYKYDFNFGQYGPSIAHNLT